MSGVMFLSLSRIVVRVVVTAIVVLFLAGPASAHHSFQAFDMQKTVIMEGVLTAFDLTNPHAYLTLDVMGLQGEIETWEFETVNGSTLRRLGISQETFVIGEKLSIEAHPPRNADRRLAAGELIRKQDGSEYILSLRRAPRNQKIPDPVYAKSIEGIWMGPALTNGLFFITPQAVKESWPLSQKGSDAIAVYDGSQTPSADCIPYAPPAVMLVPAPIVIKFDEGFIEIKVPNEGAVRRVFVDGRSLPENVPASNQGYSVGYWDDDVLMVETILFEEHLIGNAFGLPAGLDKKLTEKFSLSKDKSKLDYSFVLSDPDFLTEPVIHSTHWTYSPSSNAEILDCDPEAARRFLNAY